MASDSSSKFVLLNQLAEEFAERYRRGERPSLQEYIDRHPDLADDIREVLPALVEMEQVQEHREAPVEQEASLALVPLERLGDYRILREVGHGGMGVVYEAEQVSLGRHVALKVLPQQRLADAQTKRRFEREAKAAAKLHHTNIVPVFGVGEHDGMPYYVMQFIKGLGLDAVLEELKRLQSGEPGGVSPGRFGKPTSDEILRKDNSAADVALSLLTGRFAPAVVDATEDHVPPPGANAPGSPLLSETSSSSSVVLPGAARHAGKKQASYWQSVARIGVQVADALAHAHGQGILHRDVKPSNLLLDTTGTVWVTDFGLAKADDQQNLTHTGDILGTLRYMPPEAFDGKSDARGDVYSLGLTLYELLAYRPAFDEKERNKLVKQVTLADPPRLRRLNSAVPRDLETIVHKAIEREPARRYPTAAEFADDLGRFLDDEPIRARRLGLAERGWRWGRRNPLVAALTAAVAFLLVAGTTVSTYFAMDANAKAMEADREAGASWVNQYVAHSNRMESDWENANVVRILATLDIYRKPPPPGRKDLRGWEWSYQERLCSKELRTLEGHTKGVFSVAFSPDGAWLASASGDGTVMLWDAASGQPLRTLKGHTALVWCVAFSPDGKRLATASADRTVKLWDVALGKVLHILKGHKGPVRGVVFSRDGARLASASADKTVKLWDAVLAKELHTLEGHKSLVRCVAFSPDGARLATACVDDKVKLWDAASGRCLLTFEGQTRPVFSEGHASAVWAVAFSPDGARLASAHDDQRVKLWDAASGQCLNTLEGHKGPVWSVAFSPDGTRLASASFDKTVKLWDAASGQELRTFKGHTSMLRGVAFSPDGARLASASDDKSVKLWATALDQDLRTLIGHKARVHSVAFSPDGTQLASTGEDHKVKVWDGVSGQFLRNLDGHTKLVGSVAFSPDGTRLASASDDQKVKLWDTASGNCLRTLAGHRSVVCSVAFSPDGTQLASASHDHKVKLWDVASGQGIRPFEGHTDRVFSVTFSPDGTRLASASADQKVKLWDVASGNCLRTLAGHRSVVCSVAFSPDGTQLASASHDHKVKLWDVASGQFLRPFEGHTRAVWSVAFSPDGKRLATASDDQTVKLWDATSGQELRTLQGHTSWVNSVAFSPDGAWLASGSADHTVKVWDARLLTPDVKAEVEAVGLLAFLFAKPLPNSEVRAAIHRDKILSDAARQKALQLAERFRDETDPRKYHGAAWPMIRHRYSNEVMCRFAVAQMKTACRLAPEDANYRLALGVAQYRLGKFRIEEFPNALATLGKCEQHHPTTLAFLAMTRQQLGQRDSARNTLARLRELRKEPQWATSAEAEAFAREAAEWIEGK